MLTYYFATQKHRKIYQLVTESKN